MRVPSLRTACLGVLLAAAPSCVLAAPVRGVNAANVVNPATLPSTSFNSFYNALECQKLVSAFALYVSVVRSKNRLDINDLPPRYAVNVTGQSVDLRQLFVFTNSVQRALAREHKPTLLSASTKRGVSVSSSDISPTPKPTPRPVEATAPPSPPPSPPPPPPVSVAPRVGRTPTPAPTPPVKPACNPSSLPNVTDAQDAWKEISAAATGKWDDGSAVDRCKLSLEPQLYTAETSEPVSSLVPPTVNITEPAFGGRYIGGNLSNDVAFQEQSGTDTLDLVSDFEANVFNHPFSALKLDATFTTPQSGNTTATLTISVGTAPLFILSRDVNPNHDFEMPGTQTIELIPPFRTNAFGASFEVDCVGKIGLKGHIYSDRYGGYVSAQPTIDVTVSGGASANYLIASGSLQGSVTLVSATGNIGAVAALFPDSTAAAGLSTQFTTSASAHRGDTQFWDPAIRHSAKSDVKNHAARSGSSSGDVQRADGKAVHEILFDSVDVDGRVYRASQANAVDFATHLATIQLLDETHF